MVLGAGVRITRIAASALRLSALVVVVELDAATGTAVGETIGKDDRDVHGALSATTGLNADVEAGIEVANLSNALLSDVDVDLAVQFTSELEVLDSNLDVDGVDMAVAAVTIGRDEPDLRLREEVVDDTMTLSGENTSLEGSLNGIELISKFVTLAGIGGRERDLGDGTVEDRAISTVLTAVRVARTGNDDANSRIGVGEEVDLEGTNDGGESEVLATEGVTLVIVVDGPELVQPATRTLVQAKHHLLLLAEVADAIFEDIDCAVQLRGDFIEANVSVRETRPRALV